MSLERINNLQSNKMSAHLMPIKGSIVSALIGACLLAVGALSAPPTHTNFNHHQHASAFAASSPSGSTAAASSAFSAPNWSQLQQQAPRTSKADSLLEQLIELESKPAESLRECARWFNLNRAHSELVGVHQKRPGELQMRKECDELRNEVAETRRKLSAFRSQLEAESGHLKAVKGLVDDYLKLKREFGTNERLEREFDSLKVTNEHFRLKIEQLEGFLQSMVSALGSSAKPFGRGIEEEAASEVAASRAAPEGDELNELDATLRRLVDLEGNLGDAELGQMAELTGMLERILADGNVELNSGKFRYLSGTLDAARTVLLHELAAAKSAEKEKKLIKPREQNFPAHPQVAATATATTTTSSSAANAFGGDRLGAPSFSPNFVGQNRFPANNKFFTGVLNS